LEKIKSFKFKQQTESDLIIGFKLQFELQNLYRINYLVKNENFVNLKIKTP